MLMKTLNKKTREELEKYFEEKKIPEERREHITETVRAIYRRSAYDMEEPIGVVAAQSLSEPATQMTMRTYHFAGTAGIQVTLGLPRMLEIFDARREPKTPTMTIYLNADRQDVDSVKKIAEHIKEVKIKDVTLSTTIDLTEIQIRCKLDMGKISRFGLDTDKLVKKIKIRNTDTFVEGDCLVLKPKKMDLGNLHKLKYSLLEAHIKGIKGISQVVVSKEQGEWVITTLGSNLKKVYDIEGIDFTRTVSNNIFEILDVLGIEAARNAIIRQAVYTMEEQGLGIDVRYIMLLADIMTVQGNIRAIGRYGISGQKDSVLVRASFEETKKHLTNAAIAGEKDELKGTIENIMMNQVAPIGTGAFALVGTMPGPVAGAAKPARRAKKKPAARKPVKKAEPAKKSKASPKKKAKPGARKKQ
jgi:DNA-directed RNA polymerase subunit A"